jgi:multiple sugar transport system permease protein
MNVRKILTRINLFYVLGTIFILFWTFISIIPFLYMLSTSLKTDNLILKNPIVWIPNPFTFEHYLDVFAYGDIVRAFFNTVFIAVSITVVQAIIASLAAYAFARIRFLGREYVFLGFLATMMIPGYVLIIPLYIIVTSLGLYDTFAALILPGFVSACSIFLLKQFFKSIPMDLDESALMDGCNRLQILYRIIIPLSTPALVSMSIFTFMGSWNSFFWPLIITQNKNLRVLPLALSYFQVANAVDYGGLMAAATLVSLPLLIVFLLAQRRFIEGLTLTGMKV